MPRSVSATGGRASLGDVPIARRLRRRRAIRHRDLARVERHLVLATSSSNYAGGVAKAWGNASLGDIPVIR
jgi:hypothetical protein